MKIEICKRLYCKFSEILVSVIKLSLKIKKFNIKIYDKIRNKINLYWDNDEEHISKRKKAAHTMVDRLQAMNL